MPAKKSIYVAQRMLAVDGLWAFSPGDIVSDEHVEKYGYEVGKGKDVVKVNASPDEPVVVELDDLEPNDK